MQISMPAGIQSTVFKNQFRCIKLNLCETIQCRANAADWEKHIQPL